VNLIVPYNPAGHSEDAAVDKHATAATHEVVAEVVPNNRAVFKDEMPAAIHLDKGSDVSVVFVASTRKGDVPQRQRYA
jgi:hypothetical protein